MKKMKTVVFLLCIILGMPTRAYSFSDRAHQALTVAAVERSNASCLDAYVKNHLGMAQGLSSHLTMNQATVLPEYSPIPFSQFEKRLPCEWPVTASIMDFMRSGAYLEDSPNPRARHHFHDPYRNRGLNNRTDYPKEAKRFDSASKLWHGYGFDLTGASALDRALGKEGTQWNTEYQNYFNWPDTRTYFFRAITEPSAARREHYLALTFYSLGYVLHLLEDMGVPAHTRNDFIRAHYRYSLDFGNPFENWLELQIHNGVIPSTILNGWTPATAQAKPFPYLAAYWDQNQYTPEDEHHNYVGTPPDNWGLSECSSYQFLSDSTIFRTNTDSLYYFPHPNRSHVQARTDIVQVGYATLEKLYVSGYGVEHLASKKYLMAGPEYSVSNDKAIYEDYAKITIPRTINYVTGLANYFFRGRIEANVVGFNGNTLAVTIRNVSKNSNVEHILKGGSWELYWDDQDGVRTPVSGTISIHDPIAGEWDSDSVLAFDATTIMEFPLVTPPAGKYVDKYVVVYRGGIQPDADHPDPDDQQALATTTFYCGELLVDVWLEGPECGEGSGWYYDVVGIWNISRKSGSPQNLRGGTFEVYYEDIQGQLIPLVSVTDSLNHCSECSEDSSGWWDYWSHGPVLEISLFDIGEWLQAYGLVAIYTGRMASAVSKKSL